MLLVKRILTRPGSISASALLNVDLLLSKLIGAYMKNVEKIESDYNFSADLTVSIKL